ncbi:MAG: terminase small subunit [Novosphingobium aromaticivorans]|nr:terminase small subunit [Novosphingobium aromaticivorans]
MATRRDSDLEAAFVREYLADPDQNATRAALAAGYGGAKRNRHSARTAASRLLKRPHIAEQIQAAMDARAERTEITADRVLERLWAIATADPNEISQYRRCACRYCHGDKHLYHWLDVSEWEEACAKARDRKKPGAEPSNAGGFGFDRNAEPHPHCPRCSGEGIGRTHVADTRRLKGSARLLYAGMKETRDGIEAKMHDQMAALEKVARHLGMFKEQHEHKHTFESMSDDEIERRIAAYERGGENEA